METILIKMEMFKQMHFESFLGEDTRIVEGIKYLLDGEYGETQFDFKVPTELDDEEDFKDFLEDPLEEMPVIDAFKAIINALRSQTDSLEACTIYLQDFLDALKKAELEEEDKVILRLEVDRIEEEIIKRARQWRKLVPKGYRLLWKTVLPSLVKFDLSKAEETQEISTYHRNAESLIRAYRDKLIKLAMLDKELDGIVASNSLLATIRGLLR